MGNAPLSCRTETDWQGRELPDPAASRIAPRALPTRGRISRSWACRSAAILIEAACSACSAAPAQNVLGSFVPSWMSCAVIGLAAAVLLRLVFRFAGLGDQLLVPPLTYVGIAIAVALAVWLFWFGH